MIPALALVVAIVVEDSTPLRAAPNDAAPRQAELWRGDWLEVRGETPDFLQVWDHRRERPGYVRPWRVRSYPMSAESAPDLRAIVRFLRDSPNSESLGLGYAGLFVRASGPGDEGAADVYEAIGVMADRLARRVSAPQQTAPGAALAEHRAVAESYGVRFVTTEREGRIRTAYDGDAYRTVLATSADPAQRARAALALTRDNELAADASPVVVRTWNEWRRDALAQVEPSALPAHLSGALRIRRATVLATLAHAYAAIGDSNKAREAATRAVFEVSQTDRGALAADDVPGLDEAILRVSAVRGAVGLGEPVVAPAGGKIAVAIERHDDGQSCVRIRRPGVAGSGTDGSNGNTGSTLVERCTYGVLWPQTVRVSARGNAVTVAAQPLPAWSELWVFRERPEGWAFELVVPATIEPGVGYVEAAGLSADGNKLAVVREVIVDRQRKRSFEVLRGADLTTERRSPSLDRFTSFQKLAAPDWQPTTLALR